MNGQRFGLGKKEERFGTLSSIEVTARQQSKVVLKHVSKLTRGYYHDLAILSAFRKNCPLIYS
jgi:hypothetical protein